jgi:hypothetical protein
MKNKNIAVDGAPGEILGIRGKLVVRLLGIRVLKLDQLGIGVRNGMSGCLKAEKRMPLKI